MQFQSCMLTIFMQTCYTFPLTSYEDNQEHFTDPYIQLCYIKYNKNTFFTSANSDAVGYITALHGPEKIENNTNRYYRKHLSK